jgi:Imelysin
VNTDVNRKGSRTGPFGHRGNRVLDELPRRSSLSIGSWVVCLAAVLISACGPAMARDESPTPSSVNPADVAASLSQLLTERAVGSHRDFAAANERIAVAMDNCSAARSSAQAAWKDARQAWSRATVYAIGPHNSERLAGSVDWWPVDAHQIDTLVAGVEPMTMQQFESLGAGTRGLAALETVLFGTTLTARSCSYARWSATSMATAARSVADKMLASAPAIASSPSGLVDVMSMLADATYRVCDAQLAMPAGLTVSSPVADVSLVRQGPALMARRDVEVTMEEIAQAYSTGVQPIVEARFADTDDVLAPAIADFNLSFSVIGPDLAVAISGQASEFYSLVNRCRAVRLTMATNVGAALGVTLIIPVGDSD